MVNMVLNTPRGEHMLDTPTFLLGLRAAQFLVGIIVLGLSGYGVSKFAFDGDSLTLFTALATLIIVAYNGVATMVNTQFYNYWAILGLDIFAVVFWLISFALLASEVAGLDDIVNAVCDYYTGVCTNSGVETYPHALAAAAGLGGLEFLLFGITLAFVGLSLHRHRTAGGHCMPGQARTTGNEISVESKPVELQPAQPNQYNESSV